MIGRALSLSLATLLGLALLNPASVTAQIYAWGRNSNSQLGNASNLDSNVPVAVSTTGVLVGVTVTQVAGGSNYSLALGSNGQVYAWGSGTTGQLGNASNTASNVPVAVDTTGVLAGVTVTQIAVGNLHSLALGSNGQVYAWGSSNSGQLGIGATGTRNVPVAVNTTGVLAGVTVTQIAGGNSHSLALGSNGQVYAWGSGSNGQLGNASIGGSTVPVAVSTTGVLAGVTVTQIAAGNVHSLALGSNGQVYAWGSNNSGQLGDPSAVVSDVPLAVDTSGVLNGVTVTQIAVGNSHSLALGSNGRVYSWGRNTSGQLGNASITNSNAPVALSSSLLNSLTVTQIAASSTNSYALTSTGQLFAWGDNSFGQLGTGTTGGISDVPVEIVAPTGFYFTSIGQDPLGFHVLTTVAPVPVPEPAGLLALGCLAVTVARRGRRA